MDSDRELRGGDADFSLMADSFPGHLRPSVRAFGHFVRVADEITDSPLLSREEKAAQIESMEAVLDDGSEVTELSAEARNVSVAIRESLRETGVSPTHAHHVVQAFRRDVTGGRIQTWDDLMVYCQFAASPIGRYLLELCGEDLFVCGPSTDALCAALRILKRLRDCKHPSIIYSRLCIPEQFMRDAFITTFHLEAPSAKGQTRAVIDRVLDGVDRLLEHAEPLPRQINSKALRVHTAIVLCRAQKLARRFREQDPFNERVGLSRRERLTCKWLSILKGPLRR